MRIIDKHTDFYDLTCYTVTLLADNYIATHRSRVE